MRPGTNSPLLVSVIFNIIWPNFCTTQTQINNVSQVQKSQACRCYNLCFPIRLCSSSPIGCGDGFARLRHERTAGGIWLCPDCFWKNGKKVASKIFGVFKGAAGKWHFGSFAQSNSSDLRSSGVHRRAKRYQTDHSAAKANRALWWQN